MKDISRQSKLPGIIIIITAIFLIVLSFFYTKYSRREYMVYLAGNNSDISLLTDSQISDELNNICLPKL